MKTDLFNFDLPEDLIATHPLPDREDARLLVDGATDKHIRDLPDLLDPDTLIVFNDTKVIPARLDGRLGDRTFSVTLFEKTALQTWEAMIKNSKRLKVGDVLDFGVMTAEVTAKKEDGRIVLTFDVLDDAFFPALEKVGKMPIPPYMKRESTDADFKDYQTIFAKHDGAVASPTASLHFTDALLQRIRDKGISMVSVTLHVGAGTFLPVKSEDLADHVMHYEYGIVSKKAADQINSAKQAGKKIMCIGTTALRVLESATDDHGVLHPFSDRTNLFIMPGYRFKMVDLLLTNFHLPKSTLFVLVSAFSGIKEMQSAYKHAIEEKYRFFSYGDAMLLHRKAF